MSTDREQQPVKAPLLIMLAAMVMLYVLSVGPVSWAIVAFSVPPTSFTFNAIQIFYVPLGWLVYVSGAEKFYHAYVMWWAELAM